MDLNEIQPEASGSGEGFEKKHYIAITVLLVLLAVLLTFVVTYVVLSVDYEEELNKINDYYLQQLQTVGEFKSVIDLYNSMPEELRNIEMYKKLAYIDGYFRYHYAGELDDDEIIYMVANGYIAGAGDRFGAYYTADEFDTLLGDVSGSSVGIGVYVTADMETEGIRISYVMNGGPAYRAGLLPGDIITHVNGTEVSNLGYYVALDKIKGVEGTEVRLSVLRGNETFEKTLTREKINIESVIYNKHENDSKTGIIRIVEFNNNTAQQFITAVKAAMADGCEQLVFDVRGNPGGTLDSVAEILDFLLPSGKIVTVKYGNGSEPDVIYSDDQGDEFEALYGKDVRMAVLVNGSTASAAELFSCALKDYGKAILVGEKTYGKGCGQNVLPLYDNSGLVFTTFLYDPPVSENYNGKGIEPTVKAELSEEAKKKNIFDLKHSEDDQLKAALEALNNIE